MSLLQIKKNPYPPHGAQRKFRGEGCGSKRRQFPRGWGGGGGLSYREIFPRAPNAIARAPSKIGKSGAALL